MENTAIQIVLAVVLWWEIALIVKHLRVSGWRSLRKSWLIVFPIRY